MLKRIATLFFARGTSAAGTILLTLTVPLILELEPAADFFTGIALLYLLGILTRAGIDMYFLKESSAKFNERKKTINKNEFFLFSLSFSVSIVFACIYFILSHRYDSLRTFEWVFLTLPAFSSIGLLSFFLRSTGKELWAGLTEPGIMSLLTAVTIGIGLIAHMNIKVDWIFTSIAWVFLFLNAIAFAAVYSLDRGNVCLTKLLQAGLDSWKFCINQGCSFLMQWYPIFIFGHMDKKFVFYYTIANRMASIISFVALTIDSFSAPRFSELWKQGAYEELFQLKRAIGKLSIFIAILFFLAIAGVAGLYGSINDFDYVYYLVSFILICSYSFSVLLGPNGIFLMMTANNNYVTTVSVLSCLVLVSLSTLLLYAGNALLIIVSVAFLVVFRSFLFLVKYRKINHLLG